MAQYLITGANRGIGLELTQFALENGHHVVALIRGPHPSGGLNSSQKEYPEQLKIVAADVTNKCELENAKDQIQDLTIDVLVNNAGVMTHSDEALSQLDPNDLRLIFEVNAFAPVIVTQVFLPLLKKSKSPKLVNITSKMGSIEDNKSGKYYAYRMSKSSVNMFSKTFSIDYPDIITLNLHPGWVRTEMGGSSAPTLPRESARGLYAIIDGADKSHSGQFLDFKGEVIPW